MSWLFGRSTTSSQFTKDDYLFTEKHDIATLRRIERKLVVASAGAHMATLEARPEALPEHLFEVAEILSSATVQIGVTPSDLVTRLTDKLMTRLDDVALVIQQRREKIGASALDGSDASHWRLCRRAVIANALVLLSEQYTVPTAAGRDWIVFVLEARLRLAAREMRMEDQLRLCDAHVLQDLLSREDELSVAQAEVQAAVNRAVWEAPVFMETDVSVDLLTAKICRQIASLLVAVENMVQEHDCSVDKAPLFLFDEQVASWAAYFTGGPL